jgi:hypothetical protein
VRTALLLLLVGIVAASIWIAPPKTATAGAPILQGAQLPADVRAVLERSCQDCHSDRTRYPWYSYVAPVSLLIGRDVKAGRARLNLSRWDEYSLTRRLRFLSEIANQVQDREMPLAVYTLMHRDARLSDSDIQSVFRWTQAERLRLITDASRLESQPRP